MANVVVAQPRRYRVSRSHAPRPMPAAVPGHALSGNFLSAHFRFATAEDLPRQCRRRAVAADPDTSIDVLVPLLDLYPDEVLANPAWQLALVADPSIMTDLRPQQHAAIAESSLAEPGVLVQLALIASKDKQFSEDLRWNLAVRGDAPRAVFESLLVGWKRHRMGVASDEIALRRLRSLDASGCSLTGWRDAVPASFYRIGSLESRIRATQCTRFVGGLLRSGSLRPDAPIVSVAVLLGRAPMQLEVLSALPEGLARTHLCELAAYERVCEDCHTMRRHDVLKRALVRCFEGYGALGGTPERVANTIFSQKRLGDPWPAECAVRIAAFDAERVRAEAIAATHAGGQGGADPAASARFRRPCPSEVRAAVRSTDGLGWLCLVSSDCCPAPLLASCARSRCWWHRMCAAENPRLTPARRRQLADDPHWIVRGAARERMGA